MSQSETALKHERVAALLADEIRSGSIGHGDQLPGENSPAERFGVSRTTVRNALAELTSAGLIATRVGKGSYVLFDGQRLDARHGWARAFAARGIGERARVLSIRAESDPILAGRLGLNSEAFIVVRRVRELSTGVAISLENSWIPAVGGLLALPGAQLETLSLTEVLEANSLFAHHGTQQMGGRRLNEFEAQQLNRDSATWFLYMERTSLSSSEELVEHLECVLDPEHFTFQLEVGESNH